MSKVRIALSAKTYANNVIEKFERLLGTTIHEYKTPMASDYHPESDETPLLDPNEASLFRGLVGSAN